MCGLQRGTLAVKTDDLVDADVNLREIILIEVLLLKHITALKDTLVFQFLLGAEDIICRMKVLVLGTDGARTAVVFGSEVADIGLEFANLRFLLGNGNVLCRQLLTEVFNLSLQFLHLRSHGADGILERSLQLRIADIGLLELLAKIVDEFVIEIDTLLYGAHIFEDGLLLVGLSLSALHIDSALCLVDFSESLLDFVEGAQHVIEFVFFLCKDTLQ